MKKIVFLLVTGAFIISSQAENKDKGKTPEQPVTQPFFVTSSTNAEAVPLFQNLKIDPEQQKKRMQYSAEYNKLNFQIAARTEQLFEEKPELQKMREEIRELQEKIDKILQEDPKLKELYEKQKNLLPAFPTTPVGSPSPAEESKGKTEKKKNDTNKSSSENK